MRALAQAVVPPLAMAIVRRQAPTRSDQRRSQCSDGGDCRIQGRGTRPPSPKPDRPRPMPTRKVVASALCGEHSPPDRNDVRLRPYHLEGLDCAPRSRVDTPDRARALRPSRWIAYRSVRRTLPVDGRTSLARDLSVSHSRGRHDQRSGHRGRRPGELPAGDQPPLTPNRLRPRSGTLAHRVKRPGVIEAPR